MWIEIVLKSFVDSGPICIEAGFCSEFKISGFSLNCTQVRLDSDPLLIQCGCKMYPESGFSADLVPLWIYCGFRFNLDLVLIWFFSDATWIQILSGFSPGSGHLCFQSRLSPFCI